MQVSTSRSIHPGRYSCDKIALECIELGLQYILLIGITLLHGGRRRDGHTNIMRVAGRFECID